MGPHTLPACSHPLQKSLHPLGQHAVQYQSDIMSCMLLECFLACALGQPGAILGFTFK